MRKHEALALVTEAAQEYASSQTEASVRRSELADAIILAKSSKATQQEIADATAASPYVDKGLSRQRVAQLIEEYS